MKLVWIMSAIVAVMAIIMVVRGGWSKRFEETNHPSACIDCNKGGCRGCALEFLTKDQADSIATQLTQQAMADSTIAYGKRFDRKEVR